jgi:guanylate kinase
MSHCQREGILLCLIGPSGSGKSSLGKHLLEFYSSSLGLSVSATSRPVREGEVDGQHYHFLSKEQFEAKLQNGEFFESEEIHGNLYGTLLETVENAISSGVDLLLDVDIGGASSFFEKYPDNTVVVFLAPPGSEEMERRIRKRASISDEEVQRRQETARKEYEEFFTLASTKGHRRPVRYFIVNDDFETACLQVRSVLEAERCKVKRISREDLERLCSV